MIRAALLAAVLLLTAACAGDPAGVEVGAPAPPTTPAPSTTPAPTEPAVTTTEPGPTDTTAGDEGDEGDGDPGTAPTTAPPEAQCQADVPGLPPLVLAVDDQVVRWDHGRTVGLPLAGVTLAYAASSDVVVAQVDAPNRTDIVRLDPQGASVLDTGPRGATLFDVANVAGWPTVFYGTQAGDDLEAQPGQLVSRALGATAGTTLGVAFAPEYSVLRTSVGGDLLVVSAITDLTESFTFLHLDGRPAAGVANPTSNAPYAAPPLWVEPVLSPDGTDYAYLEGPDSYGNADPDQLEGDWQLVVLGVDGKERFRTTLAPQARDVWRLDYDGRFVVASIADPDATQPDEIVVVDTKGDGVPVPLCSLAGTATIAG